MDQTKRSKLSESPSIGLYILISFAIASVFLWTASTITNAQHETSEGKRSDQHSEAEHAVSARHEFGEVRRDADLEREESMIAAYHSEDVPTLAKSGVTAITGRLATAQGRAIGHADVTITEADGTAKNIVSDSFGYFRSTEIRSDQKVTITAAGKGYSCTTATLYVTGVSSANFICAIDVNGKAAKAALPSPPVCDKDEITDRNHRPPLDSDQRALLPIAEPRDCRNSE